MYVGGMHLVDRPAQSLGRDLAAFVDGAEHGVVLFSFGIQFDYKVRQKFLSRVAQYRLFLHC